MFVANMFMHNLRQKPCPAWVFNQQANWQEEEKREIEKIFSKYLKPEQTPSFNYFMIFKFSNGSYSVKRFTYQCLLHASSIADIKKILQKEYEGQELPISTM